MKQFKKKTTAWLVTAVGFVLALIAWGFYKMAVVVYGPPPGVDDTDVLYGPPPPDYVIGRDSIIE